MKKRPGKPIEDDETPSFEELKGFASPPCLRHEIDPAYGGDFTETDAEPSDVPLTARPSGKST